MKNLISLSVLFFVLLSLSNSRVVAGNQPEMLAFSPEGEKVEVYYFHYTRRCATCNAVEIEAVKALEKNFPEQMKNGDITFLSINIEEAGNEKLAEDLGVSGQTLLFVKGDKKIDLTNDAFMNAATKPEKYHKQVQKTIESLLE